MLYLLFVILFQLQSRLKDCFFDSKKTLVDSKHPELVVAATLLMAEIAVEAPVVGEDQEVLVVLVVPEGLVRDDRLLADRSLMVELVVVALGAIHLFSPWVPFLMEEVEVKTKLMTLTPFLVVAVVAHVAMMI